MLSFLSRFNQKNVTIFWHKPLHFSIVWEWGPFPGQKGLPCSLLLLSPNTSGMLLMRFGIPVGPKFWDTAPDSEQAWWSKGGVETRGTVEQGWANEGIWDKRDGSRNKTIYNGHGSLIWWTKPGLLFAMITKHDFDSWTVKPAIKGKSYLEGIINVHLQSFIEWTPRKWMCL